MGFNDRVSFLCGAESSSTAHPPRLHDDKQDADRSNITDHERQARCDMPSWGVWRSWGGWCWHRFRRHRFRRWRWRWCLGIISTRGADWHAPTSVTENLTARIGHSNVVRLVRGKIRCEYRVDQLEHATIGYQYRSPNRLKNTNSKHTFNFLDALATRAVPQQCSTQTVMRVCDYHSRSQLPVHHPTARRVVPRRRGRQERVTLVAVVS